MPLAPLTFAVDEPTVMVVPWRAWFCSCASIASTTALCSWLLWAALGTDSGRVGRDRGRSRRQEWSTPIIDVQRGQLLDVLDGREVNNCCAWFAGRSQLWRDRVRWVPLELSNSYRVVFDTMLPDATHVVEPYHVVQLANHALDECRRRAQTRPSVTEAAERSVVPCPPPPRHGTRQLLTVDGHERLMGGSSLPVTHIGSWQPGLCRLLE
jgi:hypothetical protein